MAVSGSPALVAVSAGQPQELGGTPWLPGSVGGAFGADGAVVSSECAFESVDGVGHLVHNEGIIDWTLSCYDSTCISIKEFKHSWKNEKMYQHD